MTSSITNRFAVFEDVQDVQYFYLQEHPNVLVVE